MTLRPAARWSASHRSVCAGSPMASIIATARAGAPPCSGPDSAAIPPLNTAPAMSAPVLATTRAANVDALNPWSIVAMRYVSIARTAASPGVTRRDHVQVVGRMAERGVGRYRAFAPTQTVRRGEHRRNGSAQHQRVIAALSVIDVNHRLHVMHRPDDRHHGAQSVERTHRDASRGVGTTSGQRLEHGELCVSQRPPATHVFDEVAICCVGKLSRRTSTATPLQTCWLRASSGAGYSR